MTLGGRGDGPLIHSSYTTWWDTAVIDATDRQSSNIAAALEATQIEFDFVRNESPMPMIRIGAKRSAF